MPDVKELRINGKTVRVDADRDRPLLGVLRDDLGLTGSKYGCGEGRCGACTVLIDGAPARSCITKLGAVAAREVTTIEGLERDGKLHPLQQAFLDAGAMQCAYCTSGMIVTGAALLHQNPDPSRQEIVEYMDGNICRCGTYPRIIAAIRTAARSREGGQPMNERTGTISTIDPDIDQTPEIEFERYELREGPAYRFELDRRDFLKAMGGGLLVLYLLDRDAPEAEAQQPGGRRRGGFGGGSAPQDIGAWLHIGEDGQIAVYTGKAEVGQNIRTSLTQAVAEELRAPVAAIRMVMADTQLTPFDMGTFGSRTTPDMSRRLRRAAAAARETLLDLAAETWKVDRKELTAADGAIVRAGTKETIPYGKLTHGRKLTKTVSEEAPTTPADRWTISRPFGGEGRRPVVRHRRAPVHLGHPAARHVARQGAPRRPPTTRRWPRSTSPPRRRCPM